MCTLVLPRRPRDLWPLVIAADRDEMRDRPGLPPGRHRPDRPGVIGGRDPIGGGSWLYADGPPDAAPVRPVPLSRPAP